MSFCTVAKKFCAAPVPSVEVVGETLTEMTVTVNGAPLLAKPPTVTTTLPEIAAAGTGTTMLVLLQLVGVAPVPLKVTVLVPCVGPKLAPVMLTVVPAEPEVGERLLILGGAGTVNPKPLLAKPPTVTTTLPEVAPLGTGTTMLVALQLVGVAATPLNVTVLVPCEAPRLAPEIVTGLPTGPEVGLRLLMLGGGGVTVKLTPLLASPATVTTTAPLAAPAGAGTTMLVALQLVGVATTPLNVTVLVPCDGAKFAPVIVTGVPTGPAVGLRPVILGAITKLNALLATPETTTSTATLLNGDKLLGTIATTLVLLQLVTVAADEPNITVLVPWVGPKPVPVMVTEVPAGPDVGFRLVILGGPPPAPPAAFNATTAAPQLALAENAALAATLPADACT